MHSVLVAIAEPALAQQVDLLLSRLDALVIDVRSSAAAEVRLRKGRYDVVIADVAGATSGDRGELQLLRLARSLWPQVETVLIAEGGSVDAMARAQQAGASYYFEAPLPTVLLTETLLSLGLGQRVEP